MTRRPRPHDWYADVDGLGHAQVRGQTRALCGARAVDPRFAHPVTSRHDACVVTARQYEERRRAWARSSPATC